MAVYKNDANLKGLWLLNNDWLDYTANNNDLTPVNSPVFNAVDFQEGTHSADFESGSSQRAGIADGSQVGLDITGNISFGAWVKPESGGAARTFIGKSTNTGNLRSYQIQRTATDAFAAFLSGNGGTGVSATATGATIANNGVWYHVVGVYDGTDIRLYVDGSLDSNGASNPASYSGGIFNSSSDFQLGARGDSGQFWDGLVDEAFVFDRALSSTEVNDIFTNGIQDPPAAGGQFMTPNRGYW